jgi:hypothetical protein
MMTANEAYSNFITKVNKNSGSNNVAADKSRFVRLFNEQQVSRVTNLLRDNRNSDQLQEIQRLLETTSLTPTSQADGIELATLPANFLRESSAHAFASTETCERLRLSLFSIKDFDSEEIITDANFKPSLAYREAPFFIAGGNVQVYIDGFTLDEIVLKYFRYPREIDLAGYIDEGGTASTNVDPEMDREFTDKVIEMAALSFLTNLSRSSTS